MFIVETPSNPEARFFIQEEEPGELRTTLLFSAVGNLAVEGANDLFPRIDYLLEEGAITGPAGLKEYPIQSPSILSLFETDSYREHLAAVQKNIDKAAIDAQVDPYQWYKRRRAAQSAQNIPITWITKDGDSSDKVSLQDERIEISPMRWDSELHTIGVTATGDPYPTIWDVDRLVGTEVSPMALEKYTIHDHSDGTHSVERLGIVIGRKDEDGVFTPLMTVLQHTPDTPGFTAPVNFHEMFTREGDTIVPIAQSAAE